MTVPADIRFAPSCACAEQPTRWVRRGEGKEPCHCGPRTAQRRIAKVSQVNSQPLGVFFDQTIVGPRLQSIQVPKRNILKDAKTKNAKTICHPAASFGSGLALNGGFADVG